jgi:surface antigen
MTVATESSYRAAAKIQPKITSSRSHRPRAQRAHPVIRIATTTALIAALMGLSACGTTKTPGGPDDPGLIGRTPDSGEAGQSAIIKSMGGGLVGGSIGTGLSDDEKTRALEAEYRALEYGQGGQPVAWKGSSTGTYGEVVAAQPYRVGSQDCRQYVHTVFQNAQPKKARGTACRNADGSWTPLT